MPSQHILPYRLCTKLPIAASTAIAIPAMYWGGTYVKHLDPPLTHLNPSQKASVLCWNVVATCK